MTLKKHLNQCPEIETNFDQVVDYVGIGIDTVERTLVLSQLTPLLFAKLTNKRSVAVVTSADI